MLILGTYCNPDKTIWQSIQAVYGLNTLKALKICALTGVNPSLKLRGLKPGRLERLNRILRDELSTALKRTTKNQIKQLITIKHIRGVKHMFGLPTRGQRTRTNASTARKNLFKAAQHQKPQALKGKRMKKK